MRGIALLRASLAFVLAIRNSDGFALPHISRGSDASTSYQSVTPASFASSQFDVIIIGGGTAGLVLANRLSGSTKASSATALSKLRIGVIDAGHYNVSGDPLIDIPYRFLHAPNTSLLGNPQYDWMFQSVPQPALNGTVISYPRGKVLGGSSAINGMAWQRGARAQYDAWGTTFGNGHDWTFDALLPYFEHAESWTAPPTGDAALIPGTNVTNSSLPSVHGEHGPISASYDTYFTDLDRPITEASVTLGFPLNDNPDAGNTSYLPRSGIAHSIDPVFGKRSYAAPGYYGADVRSRKNLVVVMNATASRIIWDESSRGTKAIRARGVEFVVGNETYVVNATKEVVLCAGSLKSPQILELSGVGNASLLESLGVPVTLDLPQVGENLMDHPQSISDFRVKTGVVTLDWLVFNETYLAEQQRLYDTSHTGAFTYAAQVSGSWPLRSLVSANGYTKMRSELDAALATMTLTPLQSAQYDLLKNWVDGGEIGWLAPTMVPLGGLASTAQANTSYVSLAVSQYHEFGRGSVHINTTDPFAPPLIDPKFLALRWDLDVQVRATRFLREWIGAEPVASLVEALVTPPASVQTDSQWAQFVRSTVGTTNHPIDLTPGTTAMAPESLGGVVNPRLKVHGLENVRVVDAGIFPMTIGSPLQQTVYAVAEKAAQMMTEDLGITG
ncbi:hypothetical protein EW146_g1748 [Bondarzewia mesenterica]|uniref:Glucose-methanol-choline oxidoreductase N-terminal domain-containing protein n=1 Tax=Bondarzewia mesenterica TaxID=1095465 RepID=A0A4V3XFZ5_9AGAM|nr:hypothetical protein EW146_g1748 [Bondarzewia mesenterica]